MRWADTHKYKIKLVDELSGEEAGIKHVTISIEGDMAYGYLKCEKGVHRLVRISPFDSNKRRHTSFASVDVIPEIEEDIEIVINPDDIRTDIFRSSGPGGQSVNTTDSAVRITHIPSGLVVSQQDQKSQLQNKLRAMQVLRARLFDHQLAQQEAERARQRKTHVGTGDRSAKIRTYNFPQNRVTDHRIGLTLHDLPRVLDGGIAELIDALRLAADEERMAK